MPAVYRAWENRPGFAILAAARRGTGASGTGPWKTGLTIPDALEFVGESVDKGLVAKALPAAQLDKSEAAIIDQPARPQRLDQRLDSGALQNHLRDLGFPPPSMFPWRGPAAAKEPFRRPAVARAEEGLLHVMGVLRERDEVRTGFERSARRLQHPLPQMVGRAGGGVERRAAPDRPEEGRPKIGMVPAVRIDGLASA